MGVSFPTDVLQCYGSKGMENYCVKVVVPDSEFSTYTHTGMELEGV